MFAMLISVLSCGNTQWSKWIYIFQAYYWPKNGRMNSTGAEVFIDPPDGYTGYWRTWWPNGRLWWEGNFINGIASGKHLYWSEDGGSCDTIFINNNDAVAIEVESYAQEEKMKKNACSAANEKAK